MSLFTPEDEAELDACRSTRESALQAARGVEDRMEKIVGRALERALRMGGWRAVVWGGGYRLRPPTNYVETELCRALRSCGVLPHPHDSTCVRIATTYYELSVDDGEVLLGTHDGVPTGLGIPELDVREWEEAARTTVLAQVDAELAKAQAHIAHLHAERARWSRRVA